MRILFHRRRPPVLALALVLSPCIAAAQAPADSARDTTRKLRPVTVTGARSTAIVGGSSAVVIQLEELRASPAPLLEQALRESPFVLVRQNSRGEMELSVRGSDSRQAMVMVNGVPMSLGWDHRTDPSLVPVTGSRNVTVVRGLGSLLNGPNTLGGTIEVEHGASAGNDVWVGGGLDENGALVTTLGGERMLTPSLAVRGGLAYRQRDGFALPSGAVDPTASDGLRTNSDLTHADAFAAAHWSGRLGRSLGVTFNGFDAARGVPPEEHISTPRFWRYPYHSRYIVGLSGSTGAFATPFGTGTIDVGSALNSGRYKIDIYDDRTYTNRTGHEIGNEKTAVGRARLTHSFGPGSLRAAVTASNITFDETLNGALASYEQRLMSAGAETEMPVGSRATIAGGVVFDHASTPETGGRAAQPALGNLGWRAGLTHEVNSELRLHASASQRSRFPALRELYSGAANRFQPNPDLKPETLIGVEGGLTVNRTTAKGAAVAEITAFRHDLEDAVVRITVPNPAPPPGTLFRRVNRDNLVSSGVELLAAYTIGTGGRAVSIAGDAMVQRIRITDQTAGNTDRHAENNPERRAALEVGVPLPLALHGVANARYTGTQYCLNADTGNEDALDAKVETDLALERRFRLTRAPFEALRALLAVDNVANATVFDQCGLVQPGRTLRLMFTLR